MKLIKQAIKDGVKQRRNKLETMYETMDGKVLETLTIKEKATIVEAVLTRHGSGLTRIDFTEYATKKLKQVKEFANVPLDSPRAKKLMEVMWTLYQLSEQEGPQEITGPKAKKTEEKPDRFKKKEGETTSEEDEESDSESGEDDKDEGKKAFPGAAAAFKKKGAKDE